MVIKNKRKFIRSIIFIMSVATTIILIMTNKSLSHQNIKYKSIAVTSGDTLWDIAKKEQKCNIYYKNMDVRDIIEDLKYVNNLEELDLLVEQQLNIPTY